MKACIALEIMRSEQLKRRIAKKKSLLGDGKLGTAANKERDRRERKRPRKNEKKRQRKQDDGERLEKREDTCTR